MPAAARRPRRSRHRRYRPRRRTSRCPPAAAHLVRVEVSVRARARARARARVRCRVRVTWVVLVGGAWYWRGLGASLGRVDHNVVLVHEVLWCQGTWYVRHARVQYAHGVFTGRVAPGASCPAPQVRTARSRRVRVAREYSTEAPGSTCQHSMSPNPKCPSPSRSRKFGTKSDRLTTPSPSTSSGFLILGSMAVARRVRDWPFGFSCDMFTERFTGTIRPIVASTAR